MGIFDDLMAGLSGAEGAIHPHFGQAIEGVLTDPDIGSLEGLLERLTQGGLGGIVQSWLGPQTNLPIAPDQLREALGEERLQGMAQRAGLPVETLLGVLAQHLPGLIDRLSTAGRLLPAEAGPTQTL